MTGELPKWVQILPAVNASLNGLAAVLLLGGYTAIRRGNQERHKRLMLIATAVSTAFLACYVVYHFALHYYTGEPGRKFTGEGPIRPVYFGILISHVLLAISLVYFVPTTLFRAWTEQWQRHRSLAKITFPLWVYVSITGVVIYLMLYHWPAAWG